MKCRVCDQAFNESTAPEMRDHHLKRAPFDLELCAGCWMGWIELEKFLIRATGRTFWTLQVYEIMREVLRLAREQKL